MSGRGFVKQGAGRKARSKGSARQNLPHHNFAEPYSRLLVLGPQDGETAYEEIAAALKKADSRAASKRLLEMVLDESYYDYDEGEYAGGAAGDARAWTRLHALRVLALMGDQAAIGIEPLIPLLNSEDDYLREDVPFYFASMGRAAVEPLARTLTDADAPSYRRVGAGESLAEIAEKHPDLRPSIVSVLEQTLIAERDDIALTAFVILSLCDLAATESMPIIERAFKEDRVDETIASLAEVQEHFGLEVTAERPRWQYGPGEPRRVDTSAESRADAKPADPAHIPFAAGEKVGRNEACPCGSGKKFKKCCGAAA